MPFRTSIPVPSAFTKPSTPSTPIRAIQFHVHFLHLFVICSFQLSQFLNSKKKLQLALVVPEQYHHPFPLSFTDNVEKLVFFPFFSITKSPTEFSKSTSLEALQHLIIYSQQWLIS